MPFYSPEFYFLQRIGSRYLRVAQPVAEEEEFWAVMPIRERQPMMTKCMTLHVFKLRPAKTRNHVFKVHRFFKPTGICGFERYWRYSNWSFGPLRIASGFSGNYTGHE